MVYENLKENGSFIFNIMYIKKYKQQKHKILIIRPKIELVLIQENRCNIK